ncbi:hypothetical protein B4U80_01803 [Leptotrombidium deliense]|uniref:HMA domain-containing protein n=1 Tax=Leptotrombidium deliense TaxID=299467 RepID=A0A443SLZ2_9ACAR|nr:hypothetical protein B4U80_01803 [Leptotrombidium deliense]
MTCDGCVGAVKRSLQKSLSDKLVNVDADWTTKLVDVTVRYPNESEALSNEQLLELLKKCGKECEVV